MRKWVLGVLLVLLNSILCPQVGAAPNSGGAKGLWRVSSGDSEGRSAFWSNLHTESWSRRCEHIDGVNRHTEVISYFGLGSSPWEILGLSGTIPVNSYQDTKPESSLKMGFGDLRLALALYSGLGRFLRFGASGYSVFPTGKDTVFTESGRPFSNGAIQMGGMGVVTADLGEMEGMPPFRLHLNVGYHQNRAEVGVGEEDLNEYVPLGFALELPASPFTPFVEVTSEQHIYNDTLGVTESPLRITPGLRFGKSGFNLDLACDINLCSELSNGERIEPYDWRLLLGLSWVRAPKKLPPEGALSGKVTDFETGQPLRAHISFPGGEIEALESDSLTGSFSVSGLQAGLLTIVVAKEGYDEEIAPLPLRGGESVVRDFALRRAAREATVLGKVTDGFTGNPISARISFGESETECDSKGNFEIFLPSGGYPIRVSCEGYVDRLDTLTIRAGQEMVCQLSLAGRGPRTVKGLSFEGGKAEFHRGSEQALERIGRFLTENPGLKFEIQGHTDSQGSASFNRDLSQKRAEAVVVYLVQELAIEAERLTARGYGESAPIADNATEEGRRKNRRIDLLVLEE